MELLYLFIEDSLKLGSNKEIKLTGQLNFIREKYSKKNREIKIQLTINQDYLQNYFLTSISNITAIVGGNGSGKTTFLEFIRNILTNNTTAGEKWLAIFNDGGKIKAYHTLYDLSDEKINGKFSSNSWMIELFFNDTPISVEELSFNGINLGFAHLREIDKLKNSPVIYYSGFFDLKGYPLSKDPKFIDISTNYLLEEDSNLEKYFLPNKSILLKHKHKNILRQVKLIELNSHLHNLKIPAPKELEIIFEEIDYDAEKSRDLSIESKRLYSYFHNRIFQKELPKIEEFIHETKTSDPQKNILALKAKAKLKFAESLITNFFMYLDNAEYLNYNLDVKIENLESKNILHAVSYFLEYQKFNQSDNYNIHELSLVVFDVIDEIDCNVKDEQTCNIIITNNKVSIITVLSNYESYIDSFKNSKKYGFLNVQWHDLSSGEKAIVDLYSRLLYVKQEILSKPTNEFAFPIDKYGKEKEDIDTIYLLLDEAEIGFHPIWQREYISKLEKIVAFLFYGGKDTIFNKCKIQIILASHSPFPISDLPKSNVIFIERSEDEIFKITDLDHSQTLGANIHTLLSDTFFMNKGLIGAKVEEKLYEIINLLHSPDRIQEKIERQSEIVNFIKSFGEPLIKQRLESIYEENFGVRIYENIEEKYIAAKKELERIEKLRNQANDSH